MVPRQLKYVLAFMTVGFVAVLGYLVWEVAKQAPDFWHCRWAADIERNERVSK